MTIPYKHQQNLFNEIAPRIADVLNAWPKAIRVDPAPLSCETFTRRFREGVQAKKLYHYQWPGLSNVLFKDNIDKIITSIRPGFVLLGTRDAIKQYDQREVGASAVVDDLATREDKEIEVDRLWLTELCRMLSNRAMKPVPVFVTACDEEDAKHLEKLYDVVFTPHEQPGKWRVQ